MRGTIEDGGGGIIPDRLGWIRKINVGRGLRPERSEEVLLGYSRRYFCLLCTPISLTAQRNGGTRQRNAFQPLLFAPARRGKVHYFRNTASRYSSAVRLPLLFPKKSFGFFGDPIFPLHKGTKALHRKNGGSYSRPPSFRPTAVFILHLPLGYFWLFFNGMGLQSFRRRWRHLPLHKGGFCYGWCHHDYRRGGYYPPVFNWMGLTPFRLLPLAKSTSPQGEGFALRVAL